jgi:hypothetical protein
MEYDHYTLPTWVVTPLPSSHDFLDTELPSDEAIMEVMDSVDKPWEYMHHQHIFFMIWKCWRLTTKILI